MRKIPLIALVILVVTTLACTTLGGVAPVGSTPPPYLTPDATAPAGNCRDGEIVGNELNQLERTPVGLGENNSAIEVSWRGQGFGGYDRANIGVPALTNRYQVFLVNVETIHMTRYCGKLEEIEAYLVSGAHVRSMQATAADANGNMPSADEIGVYSVDLAGKSLKLLKAAPSGPTIQEVFSHIQVVDLQTGQIYGGPTITSDSGNGAPATAAICPPATVVDLGPWEATERTIAGPAIVNFGFPNEGTTLYRTYVPSDITATFHAAAGKGWRFDATCDPGEIQRQLTASAGGIPVVTLDDLVAQGKVTIN